MIRIAALALAVALSAAPALADQITVGDLVIEKPWRARRRRAQPSARAISPSTTTAPPPTS